MSKAEAWILELKSGNHVALGKRQMIHLVDYPQLSMDSDNEQSCLGYIDWLNRVVPVIDLDSHLYMSSPDTDPKLVGIVTYHNAVTELPDFGALVLPVIPARKEVDDSQACALPVELSAMRDVCLACFSEENEAIPVLNIRALFQDIVIPDSFSTSETVDSDNDNPNLKVNIS
jgi:chemotaxis signal transduction protein